MMKFLVAIAMVALIGCSLTSAAAVDFSDDNNVAPGEMEDFKASLQSMLTQVSEQIKENSDFKDESDVERFLQEIDAEKNSVLTEEEEEEELTNDDLSDAEDDKSGENVESGIRCRWRGRTGRCCQGIRISRIRLSICIAARIMPPVRMRVALSINGRTIWAHTVGTRRTYKVCKRYRVVKLCLRIYHLYVSSHSARACFQVSGRISHFIRFRKRLGCFSRHFATDEIATTKAEIPRQLLEKKEENNNLLFVQNENKKPTGDVFTFHH